MSEIYYFNSDRVKNIPFSIGGVNREWDKDVRLHISTYQELIDRIDAYSELDEDSFQMLIDKNLSFYIKVINRDVTSPHFKGTHYLIQVHVSYVNRYIACYVSKDYIEDILNHHDEVKVK